MARIRVPIYGGLDDLFGKANENNEKKDHALRTAAIAFELANYHNDHSPDGYEQINLKKAFLFGAFHCSDPKRFDIKAVNKIFPAGRYELENCVQQCKELKTLTSRIVQEAHWVELLQRGKVSLDDALPYIFSFGGVEFAYRKLEESYKPMLRLA